MNLLKTNRTAQILTVSLILFVWAALASHPGWTADLWRWTPSTNWDTILRLRWDLKTSALIGMCLLFCWAEALFHRFNRGDWLLIVGITVLAMAGSSEIFFLGWSILGVRAFLARSPAWARMSELSLFFCILFSHALFRTNDLAEAARLAQEPYDYDLERAAGLWISACAGMLFLAFAFPVRRQNPKEFPNAAFWRSVIVPLAITAVIVRLGFGATLIPATASVMAIALFGLAAVCAGLAGWYREIESTRAWIGTAAALFLIASAPFLSTRLVGASGAALAVCLYLMVCGDGLREHRGKKLLPLLPGVWALGVAAMLRSSDVPLTWAVIAAVALSLATLGYAVFRAFRHEPSDRPRSTPAPPKAAWWPQAVGAALQMLETKAWPALWRVPSQSCRSVGLFFDYWQEGSPQYSLLVLLIGTLILFWAALKTQVIW